MKKLIYFLAILSLSACRPNYFISPDFESKTADHKKVAILPYEVILTGKAPKNMNDAMKNKIEEAESKAFQLSLQNELLNQANKKSKYMRIEFQPAAKTNATLSESGITIQQSWNMDPQKLAQILGVDAVVKARVEKTRYMSDLASLGIDIGTQVLGDIVGELGIFVPGNLNKTNDIRSEASLLNAKDGSILWKDNYLRQADWNTPSNEIIEHLNRKFSRRFPYRNKK